MEGVTSSFSPGSILSTSIPVSSGGRSPWAEILITFVVWTICLLTIVGNGLVILTFIVDRRVREKVSNLYILNLATADFLVGVNSLVFNNLYRATWVWHYGEHVCKMWLILDWTTASVAVWAIVLISYDRYVLVTTGLEYDRIQTRRKFYIHAGITWVTFLLRYAIPNIAYDYWNGEPSYDYSVECGVIFEYLFVAEISHIFVSVGVPVLLLAFYNVTIFLHIRIRSRGLPRNWGSSVQPDHAGGGTVSTISGHGGESSTVMTVEDGETDSHGAAALPQHVVKKKEGTSDLRKLRKSAIMLSLIVGVSATCWIPFHVYVFLTLAEVEVDFTVASSTYYIWWFNSTVNPLIYVVTNPGIRRAIISIIRMRR